MATEGAGSESLVEAIESIPKREREAVARAVFDRLSPEEQWAVLERVFEDPEIRTFLETRRAQLTDGLRRSAARRAVVAAARASKRLDTREVPPDESVAVGLFTERDVRDAIPRGHTSSACARRLVLLQCDEDGGSGMFRVIEDVFNPEGGYFVTARYDEETWRRHDRLAAHTLVRAGSVTSDQGAQSFVPVLYIGGRADFEVEGELRPGRLHLGYVTIGEDDVFAEGGDTP